MRPSSDPVAYQARRSSRHKAKSVIFLFMYGGPEPRRHVRLQAEPVSAGRQDHRRQDVRPGRPEEPGPDVEPKWEFKQYGESGKWVSDLFPNLATCVDDIAFIHSMTADRRSTGRRCSR